MSAQRETTSCDLWSRGRTPTSDGPVLCPSTVVRCNHENAAFTFGVQRDTTETACSDSRQG